MYFKNCMCLKFSTWACAPKVCCCNDYTKLMADKAHRVTQFWQTFLYTLLYVHFTTPPDDFHTSSFRLSYYTYSHSTVFLWQQLSSFSYHPLHQLAYTWCHTQTRTSICALIQSLTTFTSSRIWNLQFSISSSLGSYPSACTSKQILVFAFFKEKLLKTTAFQPIPVAFLSFSVHQNHSW